MKAAKEDSLVDQAKLEYKLALAAVAAEPEGRQTDVKVEALEILKRKVMHACIATDLKPEIFERYQEEASKKMNVREQGL